jgi:hypothetical protein
MAAKSVIEKIIKFDSVRVIFSVRQLGYTDYDVLGHKQGIYRIKTMPLVGCPSHHPPIKNSQKNHGKFLTIHFILKK